LSSRRGYTKIIKDICVIEKNLGWKFWFRNNLIINTGEPMNLQFSQLTTQLTSAIFAELKMKKNKLLAAGREVIDYSIGTPDLAPAAHIMDVLTQEAAIPENYQYAITDLPELTAAAIAWYQRRFEVRLSTDEVSSLLGSQEGLGHIALTMVNPGDLVMVPDPGYPIFSVGPKIASANLYRMPLLKANDYLIDFERIDPAAAHSAKLMIVSYPNNPVTAAAPPEFYEKLVWFAKKYQIAVVHDNAYCELVFDGKKCGSFLNIPGAKDVGVEFNSLSKSYNLTGCRLSFALGNREIIRHLQNLKSHLDYGIFLPLQKVAIAAITGPQDSIAHTVRSYQRRRDLLVDGLAAVGWRIDKPPATMFVWAKLPDGYASSVKFTFDLLDQTGVMVVPGSSFGERGEGFVRIALVQPEKKIERTIRLIGESGMV
jgi:LL-diaminopimelate aminotransferase